MGGGKLRCPLDRRARDAATHGTRPSIAKWRCTRHAQSYRHSCRANVHPYVSHLHTCVSDRLTHTARMMRETATPTSGVDGSGQQRSDRRASSRASCRCPCMLTGLQQCTPEGCCCCCCCCRCALLVRGRRWLTGIRDILQGHPPSLQRSQPSFFLSRGALTASRWPLCRLPPELTKDNG